MLYLAGLHLGPERDLFPPLDDDNPKGFWEKRRFVAINNEILRLFGGSSSHPPLLPPGWEEDERLAAIEPEARAVLQSFDSPGTWGWKDPRNSLTLRFWRKLVPDLKVIICVRDPREVAESLRSRMRRSFASRFGRFYLDGVAWWVYSALGRVRSSAPAQSWSLNLWNAYNRQAMNDSEPAQRLVTHYTSYLIEPQAEVRRLLTFAGLDASDDSVERASAAVAPELRHHSKSGRATELDVPGAIQETYDRLCREAAIGPENRVKRPETTLSWRAT